MTGSNITLTFRDWMQRLLHTTDRSCAEAGVAEAATADPVTFLNSTFLDVVLQARGIRPAVVAVVAVVVPLMPLDAQWLDPLILIVHVLAA